MHSALYELINFKSKFKNVKCQNTTFEIMKRQSTRKTTIYKERVFLFGNKCVNRAYMYVQHIRFNMH